MEFIRKKIEVEEPDKVRIIRQDGHAGVSGLPTGGLILLIGLPGSGKSAMGERLAGKLGLPFVQLPARDAATALEALVAAGPAVVEVPHKLLTNADMRVRIQASGRVIYLMANVGALTRRLAKTPDDTPATLALRDSLGQLMSAFEPLFMQTLHLLVPADGPLDEVEAMALERVQL